MILEKGQYRARFAETDEMLQAAKALRHKVFLRDRGLADQDDLDQDDFDPQCQHIVVERIETGQLVCCYRMLLLANGFDVDSTYSAQFYDLTRLSGFSGPMLELGRFCVDPDVSDPDVVRVAWALMTRFVDDNGIQMLFGCSSFMGTENAPYMDAFSLLKDQHLFPAKWAPVSKAPEVFEFANILAGQKYDKRLANRSLPGLLKTYLTMGGWVSDHAVVDRQLDTLHVFTAIEVASIPPNRARLLRMDAAPE